MVGGFSKVLDRRGNSLSQNGIAILATISSTHYLLSTSSKQRNKCSRIELKMTETEQSNCIGQSAPFVMQLALRLCFCQMPIASITNGFTETLNCSGGVTRQNPPNPPEREARASKERKKRVAGGKTPLYTIKSAATTWLPKDLRWRESRSYDVLNFLKRWGHSSGHPEEPREI